MNAPELLTVLNILVAFLGILFLSLAIIEYTKLRGLKNDFENLKNTMKAEIYNTQKAMQRVIASYGIPDPDKKVDILSEAVRLDPMVFNGYNALGYAYLEKGETENAIDAFSEAVRNHPDDKAGYFDLALAYLNKGEEALCIKYLKKAVEADPSSRYDLINNPVFETLSENREYQDLSH